jgi:hypothetical protein
VDRLDRVVAGLTSAQATERRDAANRVGIHLRGVIASLAASA